MPETVPISLESLKTLTRREGRRLAAAGRIGQVLRVLGPSIETVLERYVGARVRLKLVVPRAVADMRPEPGTGGFDGVVARVRCVDPPLTLFVLAPSTLCASLAETVLGGGSLPAFTDPSVFEAVLAHLVGDVLRCLPGSVPLLRLDAITSVSGDGVLPGDGPSAVLFVRVRAGSTTDLVSVVLPEEQIASLAAADSWEGTLGVPRAVLELRYEASLVVGSASVRAGDLACLEAADVVVMGNVAGGIGPSGIERSTACDLAVLAARSARFVARVEVHEERVRVVGGGPLIMEGNMDRDDDRTEIDSSPGVSRAGDGLDRSRLQDLPAEVIVEAGRVSMSVGQLLALAPGTVIPLERPVSAEVTLTVGGRELAHGVLVDVEGEIGVQVLKVIG